MIQITLKNLPKINRFLIVLHNCHITNTIRTFPQLIDLLFLIRVVRNYFLISTFSPITDYTIIGHHCFRIKTQLYHNNANGSSIMRLFHCKTIFKGTPQHKYKFALKLIYRCTDISGKIIFLKTQYFGISLRLIS